MANVNTTIVAYLNGSITLCPTCAREEFGNRLETLVGRGQITVVHQNDAHHYPHLVCWECNQVARQQDEKYLAPFTSFVNRLFGG